MISFFKDRALKIDKKALIGKERELNWKINRKKAINICKYRI
jgi:hypothetical protein